MAEARIDQWLWSVRIFKSRTKANDACKSGKVRINGEKVKPSTTVAPEDHVTVSKDRFLYEFIVRIVINKRVGAPEAVKCYDDVTPEAELKKFDQWYVEKRQGGIP